ncbi:MAG TPA: TRAP transporter small permease [Hydrogenophaga sp.]|nr:TRAP transporter small permease [Hydrogenophaga sp.]
MSLHSTLPDASGAAGSHPVETSAESLVASFAEADQHTVNLSAYGIEDWICLGFFWTMAGLVFLQFFSRYVLNDSFAWTEELAVYCLMPVVFIGAAMCVRRVRHIQVNLVYSHLPTSVGRVLSTGVDLAAIAFYGYASWLVARYALAVNNEPMTTIDWNKSYVYWLAFAGFALMTVRGLQVAVENWRRGFSPLQKPGFFDGSTS